MEEPSGDKDDDNKKKDKLVGGKSNSALGHKWWWQLATPCNDKSWMTGTYNLAMTLATVISVRNVNLTQPRMQMSSMYYNYI